MFNHRSATTLVVLAIVAIMVLTIGGVISVQQVASSAADNRMAPLDWYFAHDHAILDGDHNILSGDMDTLHDRMAPLDWYFAHDHAVLDGDNAVLVSAGNPPSDPAALREWYLLFDRTLFTGGQ